MKKMPKELYDKLGICQKGFETGWSCVDTEWISPEVFSVRALGCMPVEDTGIMLPAELSMMFGFKQNTPDMPPDWTDRYARIVVSFNMYDIFYFSGLTQKTSLKFENKQWWTSPWVYEDDMVEILNMYHVETDPKKYLKEPRPFDIEGLVDHIMRPIATEKMKLAKFVVDVLKRDHCISRTELIEMLSSNSISLEKHKCREFVQLKDDGLDVQASAEKCMSLIGEGSGTPEMSRFLSLVGYEKGVVKGAETLGAF